MEDRFILELEIHKVRISFQTKEERNDAFQKMKRFINDNGIVNSHLSKINIIEMVGVNDPQITMSYDNVVEIN
jgi:hypothetical protein